MSEPTFPVIDGHNDLVWQLRQVGYDLDKIDIAHDQPSIQTDLRRARDGGLAGQFWSVFVPSTTSDAEAVTGVLEQIDGARALMARYPEALLFVRTPDELDAVIRDWRPGGPIASLMGAEGGHAINNSLAVLRSLHRLGVRYMTLTHNDNNDWADSATDEAEHGGLTDFGRSVVSEMNSLGMMVDLSHVAESTMWDALASTTAPVIFSHSSARAVVDHPRNVPDAVLEALGDNNGVCMVTFVGYFISSRVREWDLRRADGARDAGVDLRSPKALAAFTAQWPEPRPAVTVDDLVAHVDHVRDVAGVDHVGLGGDYDGTDLFPRGMSDVSGYPVLFDSLRDRGWSAGDLNKLTHRNIQRVFRAVSEVAAI